MREIRTPRLVLRPFREEDAADVYAYARDPRVGPVAGWPPHRDQAESLEIIRTVFSAPGVAAVTLAGDGRVIGSAGFVDRHRPELPGPDDEIGYALHPDWWGQGLAAEAVRALLAYGFDELGLAAIWCNHYEGNHRSRRVIEKCGFQYRFSREEDVPLLSERRLTHFYALERRDWCGIASAPGERAHT